MGEEERVTLVVAVVTAESPACTTLPVTCPPIWLHQVSLKY